MSVGISRFAISTNLRWALEIDACGCDGVSEQVVEAAVKALESKPRLIVLRLASTPAAQVEELPTHRLLTVNVDEDRSNPHL
ncbi:PREDICTED: uncharacterized protein LOC106110242, partial [Papilio polytes]|uniref:uncharacterized protein LOC106110242 n=1 Tax=Papilio polytes TaxID=76194 RepID=UPI00067663FD